MSGCVENWRSERFDDACRKIVLGLLFFAVLTDWCPGRAFSHAFEAGVFLLAAAWAAERVLRRGRVEGSLAAILPGGAAVWGLAQLAAGKTVYRFETWVSVLHWSSLFLLFFLAVQLFRTHESRAGLRRVMLYFGFALSVVASVQLFSSDGKVFWIFPTEYKDFVAGPFINRDHYSSFIELVLPLAVVGAFSSRRQRIPCAVMAAAMFASVIAGASRAGSIVLTAEVAVLSCAALWGRGAGLRTGVAGVLRIAALAGIFTAVVGWEVLWQRFQVSDPYKFRREMAASSIAMVRERPGMGFGLGTFEAAYPAYALFDIGLTINHAHNDWVEWAAEGGVPLFLLMAAVALRSVRAGWRAPWAIGAAAVFLHSLVDYPLHTVSLSAWLFVLLGAAETAPRKV